MLDTLFYRQQAPDTETGGDVLGQCQWDWFEEQLAKASETTIKVICSSTTLNSSGSGWDWSAFTSDVDAIAKLKNCISTKSKGGLKNTLFVSGDIHKTMYISPGDEPSQFIPEIISSGIAYDKGPETLGFAVVEFDPVNVSATYSLYNYNSNPDGTPYEANIPIEFV